MPCSSSSPPPDPDRAPIFVVGTGRSGTTLLRLVLNAHPRIYLTHEASFYLIRSGLPKAPTAEQFLGRYFRSAAFAFLNLTPDRVRSELGRVPEGGQLPGVYRAIMRAKAVDFGRVRYGDKTPLHAGRLAEIFADFPDAKVVHVVRDPRGTVASLMRMPWAASSIGLNSLFCRRTLDQVAPFRERICELTLEDLLARPRPVLQRVLQFVGEPWDDAVLDHPVHTPAGDVPAFPWFEKAHRPIRAPEGDPAWLAQLSPAWIRNIERLHAKPMARYGYEPARLPGEPSFLDRQRARLADAPKVWRSLAHRRHLLSMTRRGRVADPREVLACLLTWNPAAWAHYPGFVLPSLPGLGEGTTRGSSTSW